MSDIYEFLHVSRGASYSEDKTWDKSFLKRFPTIPVNKTPKGNSRVHGDVTSDCQKVVIDMIIGVGSRYGLNYKEIAYALLMCKAESGFNPDAAAGTTTASGLAQYTVDTVTDAKKRAKKYLKIELDMTDSLVFDAALGSHAVILSVLFCRDIATQNSFVPTDPKYWQLLYMLHHDGPGRYTEQSGKDRIQEFDWSVDAIKTYNKIILEKLDTLSKMLKSKVETTLILTGSDQVPIGGKDYVLAVATPSKVANVTAPSHASTTPKDKPRPKLKFVKGKTDGQGMSQPIISGIGDEIIMLLLPQNYRDLFITSNAAQVHTVKKGETLSKIAKDNDTTISELKSTNHISNANIINVGQTLELPPPKQLRHKPANWVLDEIMTHLGFQGGNTAAFSYVRNHIARPKGSTSKSTNKSKTNTVELSTNKPAAEITKKLKSEPEKHTTDKGNAAKEIKISFSEAPWMKVATAEAKKWQGKSEDVITKTTNYHKEIGMPFSSLSGTTNAWCASFVNWSLQKAGYAKWKNPMRARAVRNDPNFIEISQPVYGAIALIGTHHVTFVYAKDSSSKYMVCLGGNQRDQINFTVFNQGTRYFVPKTYLSYAESQIAKGVTLQSSTKAALNAEFGIGSGSINRQGDETR